jgi:hypothetical protein
MNKTIGGRAPALKQKTPTSLPLPDQLILDFDTDLKTAKRVQASFKSVWMRLAPSVKNHLSRCWKGKTTVLIPGLPEEWIAAREISFEKAPYLAVSESLPSTTMLSFDCSASCALLWHGGAVRLMKPRTLDVFIAENILSAYIRGKGVIPNPSTLSRLLKKYAHLDYAVLQEWSETFRTEICHLLDRQHPSRIVTSELVFMLKTGHTFTETLLAEEESPEEESPLLQQDSCDADLVLTQDPLINETYPEDEVSPEITRLLDQYEEPAEDTTFLNSKNGKMKRNRKK